MNGFLSGFLDAFVQPVLSDGAAVQLWAATEDINAQRAGGLCTDWDGAPTPYTMKETAAAPQFGKKQNNLKDF